MLAEQFDDFGIVRALEQLLQGFVNLFFCFALLVHYLAADQHEYGQCNQCNDGNCSAEVNQEGYKETDGEGCTSRDEPATNDAQYAGDTEYGRITSPGTVGKRSTHSHHESNVGGRERQLQ